MTGRRPLRDSGFTRLFRGSVKFADKRVSLQQAPPSDSDVARRGVDAIARERRSRLGFMLG